LAVVESHLLPSSVGLIFCAEQDIGSKGQRKENGLIPLTCNDR
jgi:hypothetical protein